MRFLAALILKEKSEISSFGDIMLHNLVDLEMKSWDGKCEISAVSFLFDSV